jgi:hypothetical protein
MILLVVLKVASEEMVVVVLKVALEEMVETGTLKISLARAERTGHVSLC